MLCIQLRRIVYRVHVVGEDTQVLVRDGGEGYFMCEQGRGVW